MAQNRDNFLSHSSLCSGKINRGGAIKFPIRFEGGFVLRRIKWEAVSNKPYTRLQVPACKTIISSISIAIFEDTSHQVRGL